MTAVRFLCLISLAATLSGCGASAPARGPRPIRSSPKGASAHSPAASSPPRGLGGSIAESTRRQTERRQGSWSISSEKVRAVAPLVGDAAIRHQLPEDLIFGIIWVESRFNPEAVSPVGARGLMQLMPATARYLADCISWAGHRDSFDEEFNITAGSYYIARLIKEFDGDENLALAAYNAGPTKVRRWLKGDGLPKVSIEYATMVQTARSFFAVRAPASEEVATSPGDEESEPVITDGELDRLGLAILIAGLADTPFGLEREDDPNPFSE